MKGSHLLRVLEKERHGQTDVLEDLLYCRDDGLEKAGSEDGNTSEGGLCGRMMGEGDLVKVGGGGDGGKQLVLQET